MGDQNLPELILFGIFCVQSGISKKFYERKIRKTSVFP